MGQSLHPQCDSKHCSNPLNLSFSGEPQSFQRYQICHAQFWRKSKILSLWCNIAATQNTESWRFHSVEEQTYTEYMRFCQTVWNRSHLKNSTVYSLNMRWNGLLSTLFAVYLLLVSSSRGTIFLPVTVPHRPLNKAGQISSQINNSH